MTLLLLCILTYRIVGIVHLAHIQSIQRHKGDLPGQFLSVHLLEDLGADAVSVDNVVEQAVTGSHLNGSVDGLVAVEILDDGAVVGTGNVGVATTARDKRVEDLADAVTPVEDGLAGHGAEGLVSFGQVFFKGGKVLLDVVFFAPMLTVNG